MKPLQLALPESQELLFVSIIYAYTRAEAIADGVLVDFTEMAREVGFKLPAVITDTLHIRLTPSKADASLGQDYDGRLWDVLWIAALSMNLTDPCMDTVNFTVIQQEAEGKSGQPQAITLSLRAVCGPGDEDEQVIMIDFEENF